MRNPLEPGLLAGTVRHRRFLPLPHDFSYPLSMVLLDIDHLAEAAAVSSFFSVDRLNAWSLHHRDFLGPAPGSLRQKLEAAAAAEGIALPEGRILLLAQPRYLGYGFNPISLFLCQDRNGQLVHVAAEVHSTFGERHLYWLNAANQDARGFFHAPKQLHVSPFLSMDYEYRFGLAAEREQLTLHIDNLQAGQRHFDATMTLRWQPWTAPAVRGALLAFPLASLQVIGAIHWEALKLYCKGVPFIPHPEKSTAGSLPIR
jgi:DUF1365 family protein